MSDRYARFLAKRQRPTQAPALPAPEQESGADFSALIKLLEPETPEEPEYGVLRTYAPAAVRGLSGLIGASPGIGAAATGAGEAIAEGIEGRFSPAEIAAAAGVGAVGGGLARSVMAAKTPLQAAARAVPWAAAAPVVHSVIAEGELPDPQDVLWSTGIGAGTAGALGKLFEVFGIGGYGKPKTAPVPDAAYTVETNAPQGGLIRRTKQGKIIPDSPPAPIKSPTAANMAAAGASHVTGGAADAQQIIEELQSYQRQAGHASNPTMQDPYATGSGRVEKAMEKQTRQQRMADREALKAQREAEASRVIEDARNSGDYVSRDTISETFRAPIEGGDETLTRRWVPAGEEETGDIARRTTASAAKTGSTTAPASSFLTELAAKAEQPEAIDPLADVFSPPVERRVGAPFEGGEVPQRRLTDTVDYREPAPLVVPDEVALPDRPITGPATPPAEIAFNPNAQEAEAGREAALQDFLAGRQPEYLAAPEEAQTNPLQFFKSRVDAAGSHYRGLKGQNVPFDELTGTRPERLAGKALQAEAKAAGLPTRGAAPKAMDAERAAAEAAQPPAGFDLKAALAKIDAAKARPGGPAANSLNPSGFGGLSSFLRGESGAADPEVMVKLGLGGIGAATGAALDDEGSPIEGALLGGAAGLGAAYALPQLAEKISALARHARVDPATTPPDTREFMERIKTPDGLANAAKEAAQYIPAYIRANLLATPNIFNNAFVAPYGAGLMNALERTLAQEPEGPAMLRAMHPVEWARRWSKSWEEATTIIQDAEMAALERAGGATDPNTKLGRLLGGPGTIITTGDLTTRNAMKDVVGMEDEAARRITMNTEPEYRLSKNIANWARSAPITGAITLPFAKTMANYVEQGLQRTPFVGIIAQALRENPDPLTRQLVQQMLGATVGAGSVAAGYYDPIEDPLTEKLGRGALTSMAGPYGLVANAGFTAGKSLAKGESKTRSTYDAVTAAQRQLPMPSWDTVNALKDFLLPRESAERSLPTEWIPGAPMMRSAFPEQKHGRQPRKPRKPRAPKQD